MDKKEQAGRPDAQLTARARQGGWGAVLTMLLAVLVIAILAGTLLKQYGVVGGAKRAAAADPAAAGAGAQPVVPGPRSVIENARGIEASVQQQADDQAKRIDEAIK